MSHPCTARAVAVERSVPRLTIFKVDAEARLSDAGSQQQDRCNSLHERFLVCARWFLQNAGECSESWATARAHLESCGFDPADVERLPLGFFPHPALMKLGLVKAGFCPEEIKASNLLGDPRLSGRLVGPIRDPQGRIVTFWARDCEASAARSLYLCRDWRRQVPLAGLEVGLPALADGAGELIVVSDFLDAIWLHLRGVAHSAAIGGAVWSMTEDRWEQLAASGVRRVILIVNDHSPGRRATLAAVTAALNARAAPEVFVLAWESLAGGRRLHQWIDSIGVETFLSLLEAEQRRVSASLSLGPSEAVPSSGFCALHGCHRMECFCWD